MSNVHKDVQAKVAAKKDEDWFYTEKVKEHFFNPKNVMKSKEEIETFNADGYGEVGSPACGDMMQVWIKVNPKTEKIIDFKWKTFGCASAIATTSILSEMVLEKNGLTLEEARKITAKDIINKLGDLPKNKIHCSVLGDKALRDSINDYFKKTKQFDKVVVEGAKIIDKIMKITDKDIEEAVLEGVTSFEELQKKLKIGVEDKTCIPEAKRLIEFYKEKYFGSD